MKRPTHPHAMVHLYHGAHLVQFAMTGDDFAALASCAPGAPLGMVLRLVIVAALLAGAVLLGV